jgi:hypothetical protein
MSNYSTAVKKYQGALPKKKHYKFTKMIKCNNVIDVVRMTVEPKCVIKKLSKTEFVHIKTGEVKNIMPKVDGNQMRNRRSLRVIFRELRQLITTNFEGLDCEAFATMTYAEQTNDPKKILKDLDRFNHRLKRAFPNIGYIHIVEPHASGNFHIHSLLKNITGAQLNIDFVEVYDMWQHGWCTVDNLNNVDNIGAYFIAYFSNMEIPDEDLHKYHDDIIEKNGKKFIKGKRLDYYPDYMKIYRNSKNLKKPESVTEIPSNYYKTYEDTFQFAFTDEKGNTGDMYVKKEQHKKTP